jgi:hypothetical protein
MNITKSTLITNPPPQSNSHLTLESILKTHQKPSKTLLNSTRFETTNKSVSLSKHSRRAKISDLYKLNDLSAKQRQRQKSINLTGIGGVNTLDNRNLIANSLVSPIDANSNNKLIFRKFSNSQQRKIHHRPRLHPDKAKTIEWVFSREVHSAT